MQIVGIDKVEVATYVPVEVYEFLNQERGQATLSKYVRELLTTYMNAVKNDEIRYQDGPNVN